MSDKLCLVDSSATQLDIRTRNHVLKTVQAQLIMNKLLARSLKEVSFWSATSLTTIKDCFGTTEKLYFEISLDLLYTLDREVFQLSSCNGADSVMEMLLNKLAQDRMLPLVLSANKYRLTEAGEKSLRQLLSELLASVFDSLIDERRIKLNKKMTDRIAYECIGSILEHIVNCDEIRPSDREYICNSVRSRIGLKKRKYG